MAAQYPESRVLIIMTGGTICMRSSPEGLVPARGFLEAGMKPRPSFNDGSDPDPLPVMTSPTTKQYIPSLRTPPTTYTRHIRYTLYEFPILLDSSSISSAGWSQIATTIQSNYSLYDGFVILHGTDSLAYTSSALSFMLLHLGKPVILTGSQASIFALQSDAVDNLLGSLIIAGTFCIPEVCLFFHHKLYRGNRTTKVSATEFDAFGSPNLPPLATVSAMGATVNWNLVRRPTSISRFALQQNLDTAHVACLRIFPGIKPEMLDSVLHVPNLRGLILETFGAGNAPSGEDGSLTTVIRNAVSRGIVIINVSQCQSGTVSPLYAPAGVLASAGVVFGHDLTTEAALTKLSYLLALTDLSYTDIVSQMQQSLRGEMTELTSTSFSHPSAAVPNLPAQQAAFTSLGYFISYSDIRAVTGLLDSDPSLLHAKDYADNTALHLAAVGDSEAILRNLLHRGASVHVRNRAGNSPLYLATKSGRVYFASILKEAGALLHIEEAENLTPGTRTPANEPAIFRAESSILNQDPKGMNIYQYGAWLREFKAEHDRKMAARAAAAVDGSSVVDSKTDILTERESGPSTAERMDYEKITEGEEAASAKRKRGSEVFDTDSILQGSKEGKDMKEFIDKLIASKKSEDGGW